MRLGSAGEPFRWYISHPAKCGPATFQSLRVPSEVRMNAPLRVPTRSLTWAMGLSCAADFEGSAANPDDGKRYQVLRELRKCRASRARRVSDARHRQNCFAADSLNSRVNGRVPRNDS